MHNTFILVALSCLPHCGDNVLSCFHFLKIAELRMVRVLHQPLYIKDADWPTDQTQKVVCIIVLYVGRPAKTVVVIQCISLLWSAGHRRRLWCVVFKDAWSNYYYLYRYLLFSIFSPIIWNSCVLSASIVDNLRYYYDLFVLFLPFMQENGPTCRQKILVKCFLVCGDDSHMFCVLHLWIRTDWSGFASRYYFLVHMLVYVWWAWQWHRGKGGLGATVHPKFSSVRKSS